MAITVMYVLTELHPSHCVGRLAPIPDPQDNLPLTIIGCRIHKDLINERTTQTLLVKALCDANRRNRIFYIGRACSANYADAVTYQSDPIIFTAGTTEAGSER